MATKKVKKFGRGGDILTALGAGLAGYGAYKYFTRDKDEGKERKDYLKDAIERAPKTDSKDEATDKDDAGKRRALQQSKDPKPNLVPEDADKDALYESDKALVRTAPKGNKPAPKTVVPKAAATRTDTTTPKAATSKSSAPDKKEGTVSKPYPIKSKPNEERTTKTSPMMVRDVADKKASDLSVPKGLDLKGTNKTVYGTDTTSVFQKKAAQERKEKEQKAAKEREAAEAAKRRKGMAETQYDTMGNVINKRGGAIKKYASGGTTTSKPEPKKDTMPEWAKNERANRKQDELNKREAEGARKEVKRNMSTFGFKKGGSASSRADGIAIRGKTRA